MTLRHDRPHDSPTRIFGPVAALWAEATTGIRFNPRRKRMRHGNRPVACLGWAAVLPVSSRGSSEGRAKSQVGWNASTVMDEWCGSPSGAETRRGSWGSSGDRLEPIEVVVASGTASPVGVGSRGHERVVGFG